MNKKAEKFHEMKTDELSTQLNELKEKLFRLRFSHATGQLSNPMEMALCKKDIARVKTILRGRELKADGVAVVAPIVEKAKPTAKKAKA